MYNMKKNQIIITALVLMIIIAGFINYNDKGESAFNENIGINEELMQTNNAMNEEFEFPTVFDMPDASIETSQQINEEAKDEKDKGDKKEDKKEETASNSDGDQPGTAVFVDSTAVASNFFSEIKMEREQARAKGIENIKYVLNNKEASTENKSEAASKMLEIQERMLDETDAEAMIEAKGFNDAYVRITEEGVDVIVDKVNLDSADLAKIEDIIKRITGMSPDQITISPFKAQN